MVTINESKKGGIQDLIYIMVVLTVFGAMILFGFKFMDELNSEFQANDKINQRGKDAVSSINNLYPTVVDNTFLYLMIGLCIVALIFAMLVAIHPVFFILYFVFLTIIIYVGGILSNIYQEMAANAALTSVADQLVYTSHILQYLPIIIGIFGIVLAVILYRTYQHSI